MTELISPLLKLVPYLLEQLEKELRRVAAAEKELESLKESIGVIERFLKKVFSMEAIDDGLKAYMKRAQKFLYVSEDAIDDFVRRESNSKWEGLVAHFYHHYNKRTFASVAQEIKTMAEDYITMERTAVMETVNGLSSNHTQSSLASHQSSSIAFSEEDDSLVGIDGPRNELVKWLTENPSVSKMIFVHGDRGVGKTSLVGAVLRDANMKNHFKYYVWIENLRSCGAALMNANAKMWDLTMGEGNNQRDRKLEEAFTLMEKDDDLKAKKYSWALVMDDAGQADVFEFLRSHLNRTRPSVLVTTKVSSLESCSKYFFDSAQYVSHSFEHVPLSEENSRSLFWLKMGMSPRHIHRKDLRDASDRIVKKCGGLPLMILATCKLLNYMLPSVTGTPDGVKWKKLSGRLGEARQSNGYEGVPCRRMIAPPRDPPLDVLPCLFYLSIFPLDRPIRCSTMMRLWMAERFVEKEGAQPVQEKAEETLEKLVDHNLIQKGEKIRYGRVKTCRVPPVRHEMIIRRSINEEFAMIVDGLQEQWPDNVRFLSFHSDMDRKCDGTWVKQLRSLLVFKGVYPESMKKLLKQAERLKVLDLQRHLTKEEKNHYQASWKYFPEEILRLTYLRYLSLRDTKVENIPKGIEDLVYLETLDLKGTLVQELPNCILKLQALRHLLVYQSGRSRAEGTDTKRGDKVGVKVPSKLGFLTSLQKLCMIELKPFKWSRLRKNHRERVQLLNNLGSLANLQKLGISMLKSTDVEHLCSSIEKLTNLEALHLIAAPAQEMNLSKEGKRKAPEYLQRVHLTGCLGTLPKWILRSDSLVKLVLKRSELTEDPLQYLGEELWCLKHLELQQTFDVPEMTFKAGWFRQLHFLGVDTFDRLESIKVEEGALPTLEILSLARCKSLRTVPQDITRPRELKRLQLCGMPPEFMRAVRENREVHVRIKVEHKFWRNGITVKPIDPPADGARRLPLPPICNK